MNTAAPTLDAAVDQFIDAGAALVLVTGGEQGARAYTRDLEVSQEAFRVETVDATGCGDAFCAGVISYLEHTGIAAIADLSPAELGDLLVAAQATGAAAATAAGCTAGVHPETRDHILDTQQDKISDTTQTIPRRRTT